jgi:hypothetical protein
LRGDGATTVVTIDVTRIQSWFMHDLFEGAREIDLARYATLEQIADSMASAGFKNVTITDVEQIRFSWSAEEVLSSPLATRQGNSLLALLPEEVFCRGLDRIRTSIEGQRFDTDMSFYAVTGEVA